MPIPSTTPTVQWVELTLVFPSGGPPETPTSHVGVLAHDRPGPHRQPNSCNHKLESKPQRSTCAVRGCRWPNAVHPRGATTWQVQSKCDHYSKMKDSKYSENDRAAAPGGRAWRRTVRTPKLCAAWDALIKCINQSMVGHGRTNPSAIIAAKSLPIAETSCVCRIACIENIASSNCMHARCVPFECRKPGDVQ